MQPILLPSFIKKRNRLFIMNSNLTIWSHLIPFNPLVKQYTLCWNRTCNLIYLLIVKIIFHQSLLGVLQLRKIRYFIINFLVYKILKLNWTDTSRIHLSSWKCMVTPVRISSFMSCFLLNLIHLYMVYLFIWLKWNKIKLI